jgi:hypothetical protein
MDERTEGGATAGRVDPGAARGSDAKRAWSEEITPYKRYRGIL